MENNQIKLESRIAKIYEVREQLSKAKKDLEEALKHQEALLSIIEASGRIEELNAAYVASLKDDRDALAARLLAFDESLINIEVIICNYEEEKKNNLEHSKLTTEAIFTLVVNGFDIFKEVAKKHASIISQKREILEKSQNESEQSEVAHD